MTDDPKGPVEDNLTDPNYQDPSDDLPAPLEGNEDDDDTEEPADAGTDLEESEDG